MMFTLKQRDLVLLALLVSVLLNVGYFVAGEHAYVTIHDNLDSEFTYLELLKRAGALFSYWDDPEIGGIMEGIPRSAFRSPLNFTVLLYSFVPPFWTYVLNKLLVHVVAFAGMYLLLRQHLVKNKPLVALACAFLFSLLPYYHIQYGLSTAGQPLLLWAFWSILNKEHRFYHWGIVLLFPLFSFMVATLPFFVPFLVAVGVWQYYKTRRVNNGYALAILLYMVVSVIVEYPLLYATLLSPSFTSHRVSWDPYLAAGNPALVKLLKNMVVSTLVTHYHAGSMLTFPVIALLLFRVITTKSIAFVQGVLVACIAVILLWVSFNDWLILLLMDKIRILRIFNTDRFNFLLPMLWVMLLATLLADLNWRSAVQRLAALAVLVGTLAGTWLYDEELKNNMMLLAGKKIASPTYRQFYAPDLFSAIKNTIARPAGNYKVVTVGAFPNIALFNGLQTLDSYHNNYPLAFKEKFRVVIAGELAKDESLRKFYDYWGNRCYLLSAELEASTKNAQYSFKFLNPKHATKAIEHLAIDTQQLKAMQGEYVLAAVPVNNWKDLNLSLIQTFESPTSYWRFYLYQVL